MKWSDIKYLAAFIIPILTGYGLYVGGIWTYGGVSFAFVVVPLLEPLLSSDESNFTDEEKENRLGTVFFDFLLLLNIPVVYGLVGFFIYQMQHHVFNTSEVLGMILSMGTMMGACGINVAHELGHRKSKRLQLAGKILLVPSLYNHFYIEHNRGHHRNVATPEDPASARKNEIVYFFWVRSAIQSYINAWKLEFKRLGGKWLTPSNEMIIYTLLMATYVSSITIIAGLNIAIFVLIIGVMSFLLLETINYIEHYGLRRSLKPNGRYEQVMPHHSWNSNHIFGRIILYELTRHSDHHHQAHKEYQILEHKPNSPQLPLGYPSSMLMALVPPLWFWVMNKRLPA